MVVRGVQHDLINIMCFILMTNKVFHLTRHPDWKVSTSVNYKKNKEFKYAVLNECSNYSVKIISGVVQFQQKAEINFKK